MTKSEANLSLLSQFLRTESILDGGLERFIKSSEHEPRVEVLINLMLLK